MRINTSKLMAFAIVILLSVLPAVSQDSPYVYDIQINSSKISRASLDKPLYFNIYGHTPGEDLTFRIERIEFDNGPQTHYKLDIEDQGVWFYELSASDVFTRVIPGQYVTEQLTVSIRDVERSWGSGNYSPQNCEITFTQDVVQIPELVVKTSDHHLGNPSIYVLGAEVENYGQISVTDMKVRYYFTTENTSTIPIMIDYYTPKCNPRLLRVPGTKEWALELDYAGLTLNPGQTTAGSAQNQIHIYYPNYTNIDKFNDYSNPIPESMKYIPSSVLFKVNNKVAVYDANGSLIHGNEQPGYSKWQYVVQ